MLYYKVKPEADNKYKNSKIHDWDIYVKNELYTKKEVEKNNLNMNYLEEINVSKKSVYFFFGCRFCNEYPYRNEKI